MPSWTGSATTTYPRLAIGALAYGAFTESGHDWLLAAALVAILSVVRVPYSARDHVLLGLFRDRPDLRESPEFMRAVLARQGGDPERLDLEADYAGRRVGRHRRGLAVAALDEPRPGARVPRVREPDLRCSSPST